MKNIEDNIYNVRVCKIENNTGTALMTVKALGYLENITTKYTDYKDFIQFDSKAVVEDRMTIRVVKNVELDPPYKSLFLFNKNAFTFTIKHGYHLTISNHVDLASL